MNQEDFQKYLKERYEDQRQWYDRKAVSQKRKYVFMQWSLIILSAVTPVLIAVDESELISQWLPICTGALVAIGTAALKTFNYQENLINYRTTCEAMKREYHYFIAKAGGYRKSTDPQTLFVERIESLINAENAKWLTNLQVTDNSEQNIS